MNEVVTIHAIKEAIEPFVVYFATLYSGGFLVAALTEVMKLRSVFVPAEKYPRTTAGVTAVLATFVAMYLTPADLAFDSVWAYVPFAVGTFVVSAIMYRQVFKGLATNEKARPLPSDL